MPKDFLKPLKNNDFYHVFKKSKKAFFFVYKNVLVIYKSKTSFS